MIDIVNRTQDCGEVLLEIRCNKMDFVNLKNFIDYMNIIREFKELQDKLLNAMEVEL